MSLIFTVSAKWVEDFGDHDAAIIEVWDRVIPTNEYRFLGSLRIKSEECEKENDDLFHELIQLGCKFVGE